MIKSIIPSKPFKDYSDVEFLAVRAKGKVERIQVDICDGEYVKNVSWPFTETSKNDFANLYTKKELDVFMPELYDLNYTADLMCLNPEKYIETLVAYGFDEVIVHYRSLWELKTLTAICEKFNLKLYFAIDVKTNILEFIEFIKVNLENMQDVFAGVQVMGIENIGVQGQEFNIRSLDIVRQVKAEFPNLKILFDGAINDETIEEIKNAGVDVFCVGSFLTEGDFAEKLKYLKKNIS